MKTLVIRKEDADYWGNLIQSPAVDLDELELPRNSLLKKWTVAFDDGIQADLKVCSSEDDVWCEMVWFNTDGVELTCSDPCNDRLEGEWPCSIEEHDVVVEIGTPKERKTLESWEKEMIEDLLKPLRSLRDVMAGIEAGEGHPNSAETLVDIDDDRLLKMLVEAVKRSDRMEDIMETFYTDLQAAACNADKEDRE